MYIIIINQKVEIVKYGKYIQRNIEQTDIFRLSEKMKKKNVYTGYQ